LPPKARSPARSSARTPARATKVLAHRIVRKNWPGASAEARGQFLRTMRCASTFVARAGVRADERAGERAFGGN